MADVSVFDQIERQDSSPALHRETHAEFLNRVRAPFWQAVRDLIEEWFSHLPDEARADIRARLRSSDDRAFHAAFWELYLHETLRRAGFDVVVHPEIPGTTRRPDFLATRSDSSFYIEARAVSEPDDAVTATNRRNVVYDALNSLDSPNFFLWIDVEAEGASDLGTRLLRKRLKRWLDSLDVDDVSRRYAEAPSIEALPPFECREGDWHLIFRPIPKRPEARGQAGIRPVGAFGPGQASLIDNASPLKRALVDKGGAYGQLDGPFVIAVRTSSLTADDYDVVSALYGAEQVQFKAAPDGRTTTHMVRAPDGYWYGGRQWRHSLVSGVLVARNLQPWTVSRDVPTLWMHPAPDKPVIPAEYWRYALLSEGTIEYRAPTVAAHQLLDLPFEWPPGQPFDP